MTIEYLIIGLFIGLSIADSVEPIGVSTIKRTYSEGRISGFETGIGAVSGDSYQVYSLKRLGRKYCSMQGGPLGNKI